VCVSVRVQHTNAPKSALANNPSLHKTEWEENGVETGIGNQKGFFSALKSVLFSEFL